MQRYRIKPETHATNQAYATQHQTRTANLLGEGPPLHREDDAVLAPDSDGGRTLPDGLHGVLDLEEVAVGAEDGDGAVVAHLGLLITGKYTSSCVIGKVGHVHAEAAATKNVSPWLPSTSLSRLLIQVPAMLYFYQGKRYYQFNSIHCNSFNNNSKGKLRRYRPRSEHS